MSSAVIASAGVLDSSRNTAVPDDVLFDPPVRWADLAPGADIADLKQFWFRACPGRTIRDVLEEMEAVLVEIDLRLNRLLDAILHHPRFQRLEAAWSGVRYLVGQTPVPEDEQEKQRPPVEILVLDVRWRELEDDLLGANEFDRTELFDKVYTKRYSTAGEAPIGLLLGNYEVEPNQTNCRLLSAISQVAAAAFCPFVAGASPKFWGVDSFVDLRNPKAIKIAEVSPRGIPEAVWNSLRVAEDTRFLGLAVPRIVLRPPRTEQNYRSRDGRKMLLRYREDVSAPDLTGYLWGTAAWAFGEVVIREFLQTRWFGEMTGVAPAILDDAPESENLPARGLVAGLPVLSYQTDRPGLQPKPATDLFIDEHIDELFVEQGFLALTRCPGSPYSAFYAAPSLQRAKRFTTTQATANAVLSTALDAMLCVSRFSHYLKQKSREWLGRTTSPEEFETSINSWLQQFVRDNVPPDASRQQRAESPLTAARVEVLPDIAYGAFKCQLLLCPRLSPDGLIASIRLMTEFATEATRESSSSMSG